MALTSLGFLRTLGGELTIPPEARNDGTRVHQINLAMTSNFAYVIKVAPPRLGKLDHPR